MPVITPTGGVGGGFVPTRDVGQVQLSATAVSVAALGVTNVPWTFGQGDAAAVSLTVPASPAPVAAGVYAYTLRVDQQGGGAGNAFVVALAIDNDFYGLLMSATAEGLAGVFPDGTIALASTWYGDAGSPLFVQIFNSGAVGTDTFSASLYVQRIT